MSVNPLLYKLSHEPRKDLVSVSNIADVSLYLISTSYSMHAWTQPTSTALAATAAPASIRATQES